MHAGGAGAQPYLGARDGCGPGHMMIDGVVPLGGWPRQSLGVVRPRQLATGGVQEPCWASATGGGHGASE